LLTRDAHELYKKYGWSEIASPQRWMEKHDPLAYTNTSNWQIKTPDGQAQG
jgi:hypothetical protein